MPYKNPRDSVDNNRMRYRALQLQKFHSMGLEPLDINDMTSPLVCETCGKETGRDCAHVFRHEIDCPMREVTFQITGTNRTYWSRRRKIA